MLGSVRFCLLALCGVTVVAPQAASQEIFPPTLHWGSGLIDIPTAYVSQENLDFSISYGLKGLQTTPSVPEYTKGSVQSGQISVSLFQHVELGFSIYSGDFEHGFFGRVLIINPADFSRQTAQWMPSVAIGMRNIGPYQHIDRFGYGYSQVLPPGGGSAPVIRPDSLHSSFSTANTFYGVATKSFNIEDFNASWPDIGISLTLGYGDGLFSNHGNVPTKDYAADATGGLFYGMKVDFHPSTNTVITVMGENNAWDFNFGTAVSWRGLWVGVAVTELFAGSFTPVAGDPASALYRYTKINLMLGWQNNIYALLHGNVLQNRTTQLQQERDTLLAQISQRQTKITALQGEIRRYEAQNLLELEERRTQAQAQLQSETDALKRLEDRLRRIEAEEGGTPTTPPATPPSPPPATPPNGGPKP
jgi:hypothetical protein